MKTKSLLFLFAVAVILQLAVPAAMIAKRERVLRDGRAFKFRTAPVDPADAFRGRYVALNLEQNRMAVPLGSDYARGQKVYAVLMEDDAGFATITDLRPERPDTEPYLATRIRYVYNTNAFLDLPFDRFYMEEDAAPAAEKAYWEHSRRTNTAAYIQVRIENGFGVLEDLYLDGTPIQAYLEQQAAGTTRP